MKAKQKGFSLIELMIVVAIIGVLAAVAIPAYSDYTNKARVANALTTISNAKLQVSEYYNTNGSFPSTATASFTMPTTTTSIVSQVAATATAGEIEITFASTAGSDLSGGKMVVAASELGGVITWKCSSPATGGIPNTLIPATCK